MINNLKTFILLASLTALLVVIGGLLGGSTGMLIALVFAGVMNFSAYWYSDVLVLKMYNAEPLPNNHFAYNIVSELAYRAGTPVPKLITLIQMRLQQGEIRRMPVSLLQQDYWIGSIKKK